MKQAPATLSVMFLLVAVVSIALVSQSESAASEANRTGSCNGYTLFGPSQSTTTYLIDNSGAVIHTWPSGYKPGEAVYLLEEGNILRTIKLGNAGGGTGGGVETIAWDGTVTWHFEYLSSTFLSHHDIEPLPNGNVLIIAWDFKTFAEAVAAGRDPSLIQGGTFR